MDDTNKLSKRPPLPPRRGGDNEFRGVYRKFNVTRTDGSSKRGGKHHGCEYFVLDVDHDPYAKAALTAYAAACEHTHTLLAMDLRLRYKLADNPKSSPPVALPAVVDAEAVAWQVRDPKIQENWGPPVTKRSIVDRLEADGFEVRALGVIITHPAPASASEPETPAALTSEQIATFGLGLEYVHSVLSWAACGYVNTPQRIADLHTAYRIVDKLINERASASASGASQPLQAMADNERELGLGYETGASEELPPFDDSRVQVAYEILCSDDAPPKGEHWEGFAARRIVAALSKPAGQATISQPTKESK